MGKLRTFAAASLFALAFAAQPASAATRAQTRAYVMNGLFGEMLTGAMYSIGGKLRQRGAIVSVGSWMTAPLYAADACAHKGDRIVIVGHSLGATAAAQVAMAAKRCGARSVTVVGVDPPASAAAVRGVKATNFVGALRGRIAGARNVPTPGYGHIGIVNDQRMQSRIVGAALPR
jgi:hypothetical protein